ncbi:hypothetical protein L9F63_018541, partial [Diploptera punctata]
IMMTLLFLISASLAGLIFQMVCPMISCLVAESNLTLKLRLRMLTLHEINFLMSRIN